MIDWSLAATVLTTMFIYVAVFVGVVLICIIFYYIYMWLKTMKDLEL